MGLHSGRPPFSRGDAQDGAQEQRTGAVHGDTELAGWSEEIIPETKDRSLRFRRTPPGRNLANGLDKRASVLPIGQTITSAGGSFALAAAKRTKPMHQIASLCGRMNSPRR